jgi:hypothetical protein
MRESHKTNSECLRSCARRAGRSILAILWGRALIGVLCVGAAIGLTRLASAPSRPRAHAEYIGPPSSGITVRTELADIWLPRELYELAQRRAGNPVPLSDEEWARERQQRRDGNLWYALSDRLYQVDGRVAEVTTIYFPGRFPRQSDRLLEVVQAIAERSPRGSDSERSKASFHVIPDALLELEPRDAVAELLRVSRDREE